MLININDTYVLLLRQPLHIIGFNYVKFNLDSGILRIS